MYIVCVSKKIFYFYLGKKVKDLSMGISDIKKSGVKRKNEESSEESSDSDYDVEENVSPADKSGAKTTKKDGFEVVTQDPG